MEYASVYATFGSEYDAAKIGRELVKARLAACVNYFPVKSIYRWKEEIEDSEETAMIVKTRSDLVDDLIKKVKYLHPYEVSCIVSMSIEKGNPEYLEWIRESTENSE
jgi:periplasmic divalent cation tolerance protein